MKTALGLCILAFSLAAYADLVVPVDSVESHVNIRRAPEADADVVGRLLPGEPRPLIATVPGWHEVELDDDSSGFVSSDWSEIVVPAADAGEAATDTETVDAGAETPAPVVEVAEEPAAAESGTDVDAEETDTGAEVAAADEQPAPAPAAASGVPGPAGPQGPPGPAGPPGEGSVKGTENYVVKFRKPTVGGNSQIWDDGNFVGIGTTEPKQRLEVNGSIGIHDRHSAVAGLMITQSDGDTGYILHNRASTLTIGAGSVDRITIDREGNIGFGMSTPVHPVELASGAYVSEGGVWTNSSSRERKENIESLTVEEALAALAGLEPVQFNYRHDGSESHVGFIAEDVPELVAMRDRKSLSPMDVVAVLTRVVQAQQARIAALEARFENVERQE